MKKSDIILKLAKLKGITPINIKVSQILTEDIKGVPIPLADEPIVIEYKRMAEEMNKISKALDSLLWDRYKDRINNTLTINDLISIKEELRCIPTCAEKVLLFRVIIFKEEEILILKEKKVRILNYIESLR